MKLSDLKLNPDNPRLIKDEKFKKLVASIKDFPKMMELRPIIVDDTMTILGGNMRYNALHEAGFAEIPDNWVKQAKDLTPDEKKEFIVKDNLPFGEWDWDILGNNFEIKDLLEWGFDEKDLKIEQDVEEDEAPEVSDEPAISKLGEVYQLGRHRLMCGDSTKIEDVEKLMDGQKADLGGFMSKIVIITDPPYGIDLDTDYSKIKGTSKSPNALGYKYDRVIGDDKKFNYKEFEWIEADEQFWFGGDYYTDTLPIGGSWLVWIKRGEADKDMIGNDFEMIWSKRLHKKSAFWKRWVGWDATEKGERRTHPTQKPIELLAWLIDKYVGKDDIVLDLFGGSGSTLIACEQTNRTCYCSEIDNKYIDVIRKRWAKYVYPDRWEKEWQTLTPKIQ